MIFCGEVHILLDAANQRSAYIGNNTFPKIIVKLQYSTVVFFFISRLELKIHRWSLEFVISFPKIKKEIDLGMSFGKFLMGSCNPNLVKNFQDILYITNSEK